MSHNKTLIIFSKAPISGQVKTRLIPDIGQNKATQLHQYMLEQTVVMASKLKDTSCELHCSPNTEHVFFKHLSEKYNIKLLPQHGVQLGDKMAYAMKNALKESSHCVIIGTDCPFIDDAYIEQAFDALTHSDVVLGPANDGGYVLIGSTIFNTELFSDVSWSTPEVLPQTIKNLNLLQLKYHKLNALTDVDTIEDLEHLSAQYLHNAFL